MAKRKHHVTLSDHHGAWCARCLRYLGDDAQENHHVYPEWSIGGSAAETVLCWTLPVHRITCHRKGLQRRSDAGGLTLKDVIQASNTEIARAAGAAFYEGNLNLSFLLEFELAKKTNSEGNFESFCGHLLNATVSAAGSSLESVRSALATIHPEKAVGRASRSVQARWALAFGNLERNFYQIGSAAIRYEEAKTHIESLPTRAQILYNPAYLRRAVTLKPRVDIAREAVRIAKMSDVPWGQRTAQLVEGWTNLAAGLTSAARDSFEWVMGGYPRIPLSWWHVAEAHFGLGLCHVLGRDTLSAGLSHCLRSQYIRAVLALRGDVVLGVGFGPRRAEDGLGPADVIQIVAQNQPNQFRKSSMTDLRLDAIDVELQKELFLALQVENPKQR